jgi:hypothetical protein
LLLVNACKSNNKAHASINSRIEQDVKQRLKEKKFGSFHVRSKLFIHFDLLLFVLQYPVQFINQNYLKRTWIIPFHLVILVCVCLPSNYISLHIWRLSVVLFLVPPLHRYRTDIIWISYVRLDLQVTVDLRYLTNILSSIWKHGSYSFSYEVKVGCVIPLMFIQQWRSTMVILQSLLSMSSHKHGAAIKDMSLILYDCAIWKVPLKSDHPHMFTISMGFSVNDHTEHFPMTFHVNEQLISKSFS